MEKPLITLDSKNWVTGIAAEAHATRGGVFYQADGIMPLDAPGGTNVADNGLLRAGPAATDLTGSVVVDTPISKAKDYISNNAYLYMGGSSGHLYRASVSSHTVSDLRSGTPISNVANGLAVFQSFGATYKYLYYWQKTQIGRWDLSGTYVNGLGGDGWTEAMYSGLQSTTMHPTHRYFNRIYYGNLDRIGSLKDDNAAGVTHSLNDLQFPTDSVCTAISDDGTYVVIAITNNTFFQNGSSSSCRILFWDGAQPTSWLREFTIDDPFISTLTKVGNTVIAQGQYGIYQVTFAGGVKKLLSRRTGNGNYGSSSQLTGPALASAYNQSGYAFGSGGFAGGTFGSDNPRIGMLGNISDNVRPAYFTPIVLTTGHMSLVDAQAEPGVVWVATDTPKLYYYPFEVPATAQTAVSFQSVYFQLPGKYSIKRIEVVFGEPLASGDSFSIGIVQEQDTGSIPIGTTTFASQGAIRRKSFPCNIEVDSQLAITGTFNAGVPKIKRIEIYGDPENA